MSMRSYLTTAPYRQSSGQPILNEPIGHSTRNRKERRSCTPAPRVRCAARVFVRYKTALTGLDARCREPLRPIREAPNQEVTRRWATGACRDHRAPAAEGCTMTLPHIACRHRCRIWSPLLECESSRIRALHHMTETVVRLAGDSRLIVGANAASTTT